MRFLGWLRTLFGAKSQPPAGREREGSFEPAAGRYRVGSSPPSRDLLQFPEGKRVRATDIVVGFDFGTSCAKIALQDPLPRRTAMVDFGQLAHPSSPFFLPASLFAEPDGTLSLARCGQSSEVKRHLKVPLLDSPNSEEADEQALEQAVAHAAAYVGLALREARRFFLETQYERYRYDTIRWSLNLGIPSAGYDDDVVRQRFITVARTGWLLSLHPAQPTLRTALQAVERASDAVDTAVTIDLVPEVAAQVVGYARSRQRREGLHLLMDVGASTLDLCAFVLHESEGDDNYELLTADVQPLGLLELHRRRVKASDGQPPFDGIPDDVVAPLPDWTDSAAGTKHRMLRDCDAAFVEECSRRVLVRTLRDLHKRRDPNSPRWGDGLPLFVCGGGAESRIVKTIVREADGIGKRNFHPYSGLKQAHLPLPSSVMGEQSARPHFGRLSVAFGLSFPAINVGHIERPSAIADVPVERRRSNWEAQYVGKDQV